MPLTFDAIELHGVRVPQQLPWGDANSDENPRQPLIDMARQWSMVEVRMAGIRRARRIEQEIEKNVLNEANIDANTNHGDPNTQVSLPEHVKAIKEAAIASSNESMKKHGEKVSTRLVNEILNLVDSDGPIKSSTSQNFLATAAENARRSELNRKRTAIAVASKTKDEEQIHDTNIQKQQSKESTQSGNPLQIRYPIIYKFQEGYTNAVRRPVLLRDFLL